MKSFAHSQCTCKTKFASMPRKLCSKTGAGHVRSDSTSIPPQLCTCLADMSSKRSKWGAKWKLQASKQATTVLPSFNDFRTKKENGYLNPSENHSKDLVERTPQIGRPRLVRRSCRVGRSHCGAFHFLDLDAQRLKVASGEQCTGKRCKKCESWT